MAKLNIEAPDGKTLSIDVPEGTPPEKYDSVVEEVVAHYKESMDPRYLEGKMADGSRELPSTWQTNYQPAADLALTADAVHGGAKLLMAAPKAIAAAPSVAKAAIEGAGDLASDLSGGVGKIASKVADVAKGGWDALTGNTRRGFGFAQSALDSPETRQLAQDAVDFANKPHPEVGELVSGAARRPIAGTPGDATALPTGEKGLATAEDVSKMGAGPGEAATDLPKPDTSLFDNPIRKGMFSAPEEMLSTAKTQRDAVGKAIENTLARYDEVGTYYNPETFNNQVKSMLERDARGNVMTEGPQGEINAAIKDAAGAINNFAVDGPIKWSDAARIKTLLQGETKYGVQGLSKADEAYKQVASLLKEDIDNQAMEMLRKQGGDVANYQQLRTHYAKYATLSDSLNVAARRQAANSVIPWWVKMGAGAALGSTGASIVKGMVGH